MDKVYRIDENELNKIKEEVGEDKVNIVDKDSLPTEDKINVVEISFYEDMSDTEAYFQERFNEYVETARSEGKGEQFEDDDEPLVWGYVDREKALSMYIGDATCNFDYDRMNEILSRCNKAVITEDDDDDIDWF